MNGIVTLTTDFSTADAYVGMMKGAILSIDPTIYCVDLAHEVQAHDVMEAAFVLESAYTYFPKGTVHLVVVDPGVGSLRRRVAVSCGGYYFVGPDNGVFSYVLRESSTYAAVEIAVPREREGLHGVTFEGRDIFGPAAAKLASGVKLADIGTRVESLVSLDTHGPKMNENHIDGRIVYVDHFGNCVSNIRACDLEGLCEPLSISVGGFVIGELTTSYSGAAVGDSLAVINSLDRLEIAINQGNAHEDMNITVGTPVRVSFTK